MKPWMFFTALALTACSKPGPPNPAEFAKQAASADSQRWFEIGNQTGAAFGKLYRKDHAGIPTADEISAASLRLAEGAGVQGELNSQAFRDGFASGLQEACRVSAGTVR